MEILEVAYRIQSVSVVDVSGRDAMGVVNNLTTNNIAELAEEKTLETFITDVRGKTIGHVWVNRIEDGLRMIGAAGQSERLIEHFDQYTVRERYEAAAADGSATLLTKRGRGEFGDRISASSQYAFSVDWVGPECIAVLDSADTEEVSEIEGLGDEDSFHRCRVASGMPWYGIDFDESNLPQEVDRDDVALSLTKGCYLGQETVARLDALGQVQKKLVCWRIDGNNAAKTGCVLFDDEKKVGKLTSVVASGDHQLAIGWARRSHFEVGSKAHLLNAVTGEKTEAIVIHPEVSP